MKKLNHLVVALILTAFMACKKENSTVITMPRSVNLADTLTVKMNETVFSGDFSIKLDSVQESRCPTDINCIWAGLANARLIVKKDSNRQNIQLVTYPLLISGLLDTVTVFNQHIRLLSVSPYPNSAANRITQSDYVVKLLVR